MPRWISKALRAMLYGLVGLAVLLTVLVGLISTPWFRHALQRQLILGLEELTGGRVETRALHFNPLILQVTLDGLTIHGSELRGAPPFFVAQRVVARLSVVPLAHRKLWLRALDCENAAIHLLTTPDGSTNFPGPRTSSRAGEWVGLSIGRLTVAHTQIEWNDRRLPIDVDARSVAILLRDRGAHRYVGSLSSFATQIQSARWSPSSVTLTSQFELSPEGLNVNSLTWQSSGFVGHCSLTLRNPASPSGSMAFATQIEVPELRRSLRAEQLREGTISVEGQVSYQLGEFTARGRFEARRLLFQSPLFAPGSVDLSGDYLADRRHVEVSRLVISALGGTARGGADVSFRGGSSHFVLRTGISGLEMAAALHSFPRAKAILGRLPHLAEVNGTAEATWSGFLQAFRSEFDLHFQPLRNQLSNIVPISGHARGLVAIARGVSLDLRSARFQTPHSVLSAKRKLGSSDSSLSFELVTRDFEEWRSLAEFFSSATRPLQLSFESPVNISGAIIGTSARRQVRARLAAGKFQYAGWKWDGLTAGLVMGPDFVQVSSGQLQGGKSTLALDASATLDNWVLAPRSSVHLSVRAQKTPMEALNAILDGHQTLSGLASGHLEFAGPPAGLSGSGDLRVEQGAFWREPFDLLSAHIRIAASVWNLESVQLTKGRGRLAGDLRFDPARRAFSAEFHGNDFSLAEFQHLSLPRPKSSHTPWLDGLVQFDVQGNGTVEDPRLHSTWTIHQVLVDGDRLGDVRADLNWQDKELRLEGGSEGPGAVIRFSGRVETQLDWPVVVRGEYANFQAEPWLRLLLNRKINAVVSASGSFGVTGSLKQKSSLEAQTQARSLEVRFPSLLWENERPLDLHYAQGVLTVEPFRMRGPSTDLEVQGLVHFGQPSTLSLKAEGKAEAALLTTLLEPTLQAAGSSELKLHLNADLSPERPVRPQLNGTLDVHDLSLKYADLPFRVSGLNGEIRLEGERATVTSLRGAVGGGSVTVTGFSALGETPRYDLQAKLDQVRVPYPSNFTSVVNGNLRLIGTTERGQLGGELTVRQVFVGPNFNLVERLVQGVSPLEKPLNGLSSPFASKTRLNIQLNSGPPLRLETREWSLLADLDLSVQGTLASPVQLGVIHLRSGEASFRGNRYKLRRGELHLSNPFRTEPMLDLEASTRVQRYDLTVDISGSLDRLKLAYRSDPPLPTEDVLSLLALGFSQQQGEMSTAAAGRPLPTTEAGALLSQALSSQVTGRVQRLFGVSRIKVDPNVSGTGGPGGARVTFEQQVTRDLTLTYITNTTTSQYRVIQFEWAVNENTSLIGIRDQNGIFGLEVKFHKRFH